MAQALALPMALALTLAQVALAAAEQPLLGGAFEVCSRRDPQLQACILRSLNGARDKLLNGIPELEIPSLNPLRGSKMVIHEGEEEFNFQLSFTNWSWSGLTDFVATRVRLEFSPPYLEFDTSFNKVNLSGPYQFGGSILTLRMNGNGDGFVSWGCNATHRLRLVEEKRNGQVHWRVTDYDFQMDVTRFLAYLGNLFRGNKRLGTYANRFMNKNWRPAYAIYRVVICNALRDALKELVLDRFLARVPLAQFFAP